MHLGCLANIKDARITAGYNDLHRYHHYYRAYMRANGIKMDFLEQYKVSIKKTMKMLSAELVRLFGEKELRSFDFKDQTVKAWLDRLRLGLREDVLDRARKVFFDPEAMLSYGCMIMKTNREDCREENVRQIIALALLTKAYSSDIEF